MRNFQINENLLATKQQGEEKTKITTAKNFKNYPERFCETLQIREIIAKNFGGINV